MQQLLTRWMSAVRFCSNSNDNTSVAQNHLIQETFQYTLTWSAIEFAIWYFGSISQQLQAVGLHG